MNSKLIFLILASSSFLLILRLALHFVNFKPYPQGKTITFETQLQNQPKISNRGQQVSLTMPNSQRVTARLVLNPLLSYGDKIKIEGRLNYFEGENSNKIAFMNYPKFAITEKGNQQNLILKARESIIGFFNSNLNPKYSSLMLGIVFGIKQEMPQGFYDSLQKTGMLHVIAASGMNITMVGGFFLGLFGLFLRRQLALLLTILGILFYALMAGLEPSIVRATVMGILVFSAQLTGRQTSSFLGLFIAGFIMLFKNPSLLFDLGFQLSFMATLGLIYFRPLFFLNQKLKRLIEKSIIGEDLATTISAQVFTLPILLVNFGSYSLTSVLVNAIVLWTVPVIMILGGLSAVLALIVEPLGTLILYLSIPFLLYFEKVVEIFSKWGGQFEIKSLPILVICGYYLILVSTTLFLKQKK